MRHTASLAIFAIPLTLSTFACGDLGDDDRSPPIATIDGQLSRASAAIEPAPASNVRVAIVWNTRGEFRSTYDVEVVPVFPSRFRLELRGAPPAAAMLDLVEPDPTVDHPTDDLTGRSHPLTADAGFTYAVGTVVAYEDLNGNGKLDLINADNPPIDRVLGANRSLGIVYIEGTPPADFMGSEGSPVRGYNLLTVSSCQALDVDAPAPPCESSKWLPITTNYDLPLGAEPQLAEMMCGSNESSSEAGADRQPIELPVGPGPNGWPAKDAEGLVCAKDGKSYSLTRCETKSKGLCKGTIETCTNEAYRAPEPAPAEWPCSK